MRRCEKTIKYIFPLLFLCLTLCIGLFPVPSVADETDLRITVNKLNKNHGFYVEEKNLTDITITQDVEDAHIVISKSTVSGTLTVLGGCPKIELVNASVERIIIMGQPTSQQSGAAQLVADAKSHVGTVEVYGALHIAAVGPDTVSQVDVRTPQRVQISAPLRLLTVQDAAQMQIHATVDVLKLQRSAFVQLMEQAHVGRVEVSPLSVTEEATMAYIDTGLQGSIGEIISHGALAVGGSGYVESIRADGQRAQVRADITLTGQNGQAVRIEAIQDGHVAYANSVRLPMRLAPLRDLFLTEQGARRVVPLSLLDGYGAPLDMKQVTLSATSSCSEVAKVEIENGELVIQPGDVGVTNVVVAATRPGYGVTKIGLAVRVFAARGAQQFYPLEVSTKQSALELAVGKQAEIKLISNQEDTQYRVISSDPTVARVSIYRGKIALVAESQGHATITVEATKPGTSRITYVPTQQTLSVDVLSSRSELLPWDTALSDVRGDEAQRLSIGDTVAVDEDCQVSVVSSAPDVATAELEGDHLVIKTGSTKQAVGAATITVTLTKPEKKTGARTISYLPQEHKFVVLVERGPIRLTMANQRLVTDKVYDGNNSVEFDPGQPVGIEADQQVQVVAKAQYSDGTIGKNKQITIRYTLTGPDAAGYLAPADQTLTGSISPRPLTLLLRAEERDYAPDLLEVPLAVEALEGLLIGDEVEVAGSLVGRMADADAGEHKPVQVDALTLSGKDASKYQLTVAPVTVSIHKVQQAFATMDIPTDMACGESLVLPGDSTYALLDGEARLLGTELTATQVGIITVQATRAGDKNHQDAPPVTHTITVGKGQQAPLAIVSDTAVLQADLAAYTLRAQGGTGEGEVTFAIVPGGTARDAALQGDRVTAAGCGTVLIQAAKDGQDNYHDTDSPVFTLEIAGAYQPPLSIMGPATHRSGTVYRLGTMGGSGDGAVTYRLLPESTGVGQITGDGLEIRKAGTFCIVAEKAGDDTFAAVRSEPFVLTVTKAEQPEAGDPQAIRIASPDTHTFGTPYTLRSEGGLGEGGVRYVIVGGDGAGEIVGDKLHITRSGTIALQATKLGDETHFPGTSAVMELTVSKAPQPPRGAPDALTIVGPGVHMFGLPYGIQSSGGLGEGEVRYAIVGGTGSGSVSGNVLDAERAGTFDLQATKLGDANYLPATSAVFTVTVRPGEQADPPLITGPAVHVYGEPYVLQATSGQSTGGLWYEIVGGTGIGSIAGDTLTVQRAGTFWLRAVRDGDTNHLPATGSIFVLDVQKRPQPDRTQPDALVITSPDTHQFGMPYRITSQGGLGEGLVRYTLVGGSGHGEILGDMLQITDSGSFDLQATKLGDDNHEPGTSSVFTVTVHKRMQTQPLTLTVDPKIPFGQQVTLQATGGEGEGALRYELLSGEGRIDGDKLTAHAVGRLEVVAVKDGDSNFEEQRTTPQRIEVVGYAPQNLTLTVEKTEDLLDMRYLFRYEADCEVAPGDVVTYTFVIQRMYPDRGSVRDQNDDHRMGSARLAKGEYIIEVTATGTGGLSNTASEVVEVAGTLSKSEHNPYPGNVALVSIQSPGGLPITSYSILVATNPGHNSTGEIAIGGPRNAGGDHWTLRANGEEMEDGWCGYGFVKNGTFKASQAISNIEFRYEIVTHAQEKDCLDGKVSYTIYFALEPRDDP